MINIFHIDDHKKYFLEGVSDSIKQSDSGMTMVGHSTSCLQAIELFGELNVDVVLLDIHMPEMNGIDCCRKIKRQNPLIKVVVLTDEVDPFLLLEMWQSNANAILLKSCGLDELLATIKGVMNNRTIFGKGVPDFFAYNSTLPNEIPKLTRKELEILKLLATGLSRKEVANETNVTVYSVDFHCKNIFKKFKKNNVSMIIEEAKKARIII
jgi:DNA-binding NarL/FixJ family response regulator